MSFVFGLLRNGDFLKNGPLLQGIDYYAFLVLQTYILFVKISVNLLLIFTFIIIIFRYCPN